MPRAQAGARYRAEEQRETETVRAIALTPDVPVAVATAPLFEAAAVHDGQPPMAWLQMFRACWGRLEEC